MHWISLILNLHNETDHQSIVPLRKSVCRTDQEALWTRQAFIKVTLIVNDTEPYRRNLEVHQTGSNQAWINHSWWMSLSLLSCQRAHTTRSWLPLQRCYVAIMDDFLSAAANSVVCNTFPRQKIVNLKAEKSLQVELGKASCNAIQPVINSNANQCD